MANIAHRPTQLPLFGQQACLEPGRSAVAGASPAMPPVRLSLLQPHKPDHATRNYRASNPRAQGVSEHTEDKQRFLRRILHQQLVINGNIQRKWAGEPPMVYLDLFAGTGHDAFGKAGSPLIFLQEAGQLDTRIHPAFFNIELEQHHALRDALGSIVPGTEAATGEPLVRHDEMVHFGDCETDALAHLALHGKRYSLRDMKGVVYADPNGRVPWTLLAQIAAKAPKLDILIHCSTGTPKRLRACGEVEDTAYLSDYVAQVRKEKWFITQPATHQGWSFLFGTNFPGQDGLKKAGLVQLKSHTGQTFFSQANYTRAERSAQVPGNQGTLEFGGAL